MDGRTDGRTDGKRTDGNGRTDGTDGRTDGRKTDGGKTDERAWAWAGLQNKKPANDEKDQSL